MLRHRRVLIHESHQIIRALRLPQTAFDPVDQRSFPPFRILRKAKQTVLPVSFRRGGEKQPENQPPHGTQTTADFAVVHHIFDPVIRLRPGQVLIHGGKHGAVNPFDLRPVPAHICLIPGLFGIFPQQLEKETGIGIGGVIGQGSGTGIGQDALPDRSVRKPDRFIIVDGAVHPVIIVLRRVEMREMPIQIPADIPAVLGGAKQEGDGGEFRKIGADFAPALRRTAFRTFFPLRRARLIERRHRKRPVRKLETRQPSQFPVNQLV